MEVDYFNLNIIGRIQELFFPWRSAMQSNCGAYLFLLLAVDFWTFLYSFSAKGVQLQYFQSYVPHVALLFSDHEQVEMPLPATSLIIDN